MNAGQHLVALVDYDEALFAPIGSEADILAEHGCAWIAGQHRTEEAVLKVAKAADVIAIQSVRPLLTRKVIGDLERCRCMIRAGAGYDSIDCASATERGIMVCNTPTYCTDDVADHAIALMLSCVRHIPRLNTSIHRGAYERELAKPTRRVTGTTLGIIGLGRIGSTVARRVRGWDMTVLAYDPYISQEVATRVGVTLVGLDELLQRADFLSVHCPLTEETRHLLGRDAFSKIKSGLVLVNTARGPIVDEEPLIEALRQGRVWSAGLDVTETEPLPEDSALLGFDNVILTPHISANSPQARRDLYRLICEISIDVIEGRIPPFVVNPEVLDHVRSL